MMAAIKPKPWLILLAISSPKDCPRRALESELPMFITSKDRLYFLQRQFFVSKIGFTISKNRFYFLQKKST
jgi:hypothetical protein